jgi:hypothetical protein
MNYKYIITLSTLFTFITGVLSQSCPLKCPSCTRCDPKKGTCSLPRDFVTCTKSGLSGVCFAGTCNTQVTLPISRATNRCQTYTCPPSGECKLITAPDGFDCTPQNVNYESACMGGVCQRIWLGLGEEMPYKNSGCIGKPDGVTCDTNHLLTDGEKCLGGVCRFPDGSYYGYI